MNTVRGRSWMAPAVAALSGCLGPSASGGEGWVVAPPETVSVRVPALEEIPEVRRVWSVSLTPLKLHRGTAWWPDQPIALAWSDSLIAVLDAGNGEAALIRVRDGVGQRVFGGLGQGDGEYFGPSDISAFPSGFAVADPSNGRVGIVDGAGTDRGMLSVPGIMRLARGRSGPYALVSGVPPKLLVLGVGVSGVAIVESVSLAFRTPAPAARFGMAVLPNGSVALPTAPDEVLLTDSAGQPQRLLRLAGLQAGFPIRAVTWQPPGNAVLLAVGPILLCVDVDARSVLGTARMRPAPDDPGLYPIQAITATDTAVVVLEMIRPRVSLVTSPCERGELLPVGGS